MARLVRTLVRQRNVPVNPSDTVGSVILVWNLASAGGTFLLLATHKLLQSLHRCARKTPSEKSLLIDEYESSDFLL